MVVIVYGGFIPYLLYALLKAKSINTINDLLLIKKRYLFQYTCLRRVLMGYGIQQVSVNV